MSCSVPVGGGEEPKGGGLHLSPGTLFSTGSIVIASTKSRHNLSLVTRPQLPLHHTAIQIIPAFLLILVEPVLLLGPHWHLPLPVETPERVQSASDGVQRLRQVFSLVSLLLEGDSLYDDQEASDDERGARWHMDNSAKAARVLTMSVNSVEEAFMAY